MVFDCDVYDFVYSNRKMPKRPQFKAILTVRDSSTTIKMEFLSYPALLAYVTHAAADKEAPEADGEEADEEVPEVKVPEVKAPVIKTKAVAAGGGRAAAKAVVPVRPTTVEKQHAGTAKKKKPTDTT